jgi:hypothetical protein
MKTSWQTETGALECRWDDLLPADGQRLDKNRPKALENSTMRGSYLPPPPDFASHSPFGGATWFYPNPANCILTQI